jgi:hypothetical protein
MYPHRIMRTLQLTTLMALTAFHPCFARADAFPYVYEWREYGNPDGSLIQGGFGKLFLDAPASAHGSLSDIGPGSYVQFNNLSAGTFPGNSELIQFTLSPFTAMLQDPIFSWNASGIIEMSIGFSGTVPGLGSGGGGIREGESVLPGSGNGPNELNFSQVVAPPNHGFVVDWDDTEASWVSPSSVVPDSGSSWLLLSVALAGLAACRFRQAYANVGGSSVSPVQF